jgi:CheY-like chemotaxis protein
MQWRQAVGSILGAGVWLPSAGAGPAGPRTDLLPPEATATAAPGQGPPPVPLALALSALQVLLVDDSPANLHDGSQLLSQWGIVPTVAGDGAQALELASERQFDLIMMDISMPVMDGMEATLRIRQLETAHPERRRTPIVAYTSGALLADKTLQVRVGFDEAINKPCGADLMAACLRRWCPTTAALLPSQPGCAALRPLS